VADANAILLVTHGSLLCGSDDAVYQHARRLRDSRRFACVAVGFLNYGEPSLEAALEANITLVEALGEAPELATAILRSAAAAEPLRVASGRRRRAAAATCRRDPTCPLAGTDACALRDANQPLGEPGLSGAKATR
jgi:hypothetical protein